MDVNNLKQLMIEELKDLYDAEKQITEALPKMIEKANNPSLRQAFEDHLVQTKDQVRRLEDALDELNVSDRQKECKGMQALIEEGEEMIKDTTDADTRDAALIASAQRVEHYEMAAYGTIISYSHQLDHDNVADTLQPSLNEEKETDLKLSQLAEEKINVRAK
jgi:ferritin-like metal-binding protein YciE